MAAENAPQARPIQARRVSSGDVSSASRPAAAARPRAGAAASGRRRRQRTPTEVVLPARSGRAAGGRAPARAAGARPARLGAGTGLEWVSGFCLVEPCASHPIAFSASSAACRTFMLRSCWLRVAIGSRSASSFSAAAARSPLIITSAIGSRSSSCRTSRVTVRSTYARSIICRMTPTPSRLPWRASPTAAFQRTSGAAS